MSIPVQPSETFAFSRQAAKTHKTIDQRPTGKALLKDV